MNWQADTELRRLVDGMLDGSLSRAEAARLEERMEADPLAMDYYLSLAGQEAQLKEALREPGFLSPEITRPKTVKLRGWFAVAAALTAIAALTANSLRQSPEKTLMTKTGSTNGATLTNEVGVIWNRDPVSVGTSIENGVVVDLVSGLAELTHESGTRLLIEGPASYQITGPNSGKLEYGKLVAEVPPGAEGFVVEYVDGKVVDLGTEFAISAPLGALSAEVGVFRGEVRVQQAKESFENAAPLYTGHAIRTASPSATGLRSIPFDQDQYVRQIPSRELPWFYRGNKDVIEWDVSHLVWSDGEYLGVMKWMNGPEALNLSKMELLLNGEVVSTDEHPCSVGHLSSTVGNIYHLNVKPGAWKRGQWTLRAWPQANLSGGHSEGILMFENGASLAVSPGDFTGPWEYVHDGNRYLRKFHPDGSCSLWINGTPSDYFQDASWVVVDGILRVNFPATSVAEEHLLRDGDSLLFINQPYRNARRGK